MENDPKNIWQNQPTEPSALTAENLRLRSQELNAKTRRALLGWAALPLLIAGLLGWAVVKIQGGVMQQTAFAVAVAWSVAGQYFLNRGMWQPEQQAATAIDSYRRAVERRRYISARYLLWTFAPVVLAIATFVTPLLNRGMVMRMIPFLTLVVIWIATVFVIRARDERELRREIAELDSVRR